MESFNEDVNLLSILEIVLICYHYYLMIFYKGSSRDASCPGQYFDEEKHKQCSFM